MKIYIWWTLLFLQYKLYHCCMQSLLFHHCVFSQGSLKWLVFESGCSNYVCCPKCSSIILVFDLLMVGSDSEMGACCNCDWSCFPPFLGEKEDLVNYPPLAHYNIGDGGGGFTFSELTWANLSRHHRLLSGRLTRDQYFELNFHLGCWQVFLMAIVSWLQEVWGMMGGN